MAFISSTGLIHVSRFKEADTIEGYTYDRSGNCVIAANQHIDYSYKE